MPADEVRARGPSIKERRATKKVMTEDQTHQSEQHVHWQINVATDDEAKDSDALQTPNTLRRSPRFPENDKSMHSILKANNSITKTPKKVFTRRKAGQDSAGRLPGQDPLIIDLERLKTHFGVSQRAACTQLGIGLSTMKRLCRKFGIKRWPGRRRGSEDGTASENEDTPVEQHDVTDHASLTPNKPAITFDQFASFDFTLPSPITLEDGNLPCTRSATTRKIAPLWNFTSASLPTLWPNTKTPPSIFTTPMWGAGLTGRTPPAGLLPSMWGPGKTPPATTSLPPVVWPTGKTPPGIAPLMWGRTVRAVNTPKNLVLDTDLAGAIAGDLQHPFETSPELFTPRNHADWTTPRSTRGNALNGLFFSDTATLRLQG
jgi:hypothetical protein